MSPERKRPESRKPRDTKARDKRADGQNAERRQELVTAGVSTVGLVAIVTTFALTGATEAAAFAAGLGTGAAGVYLAIRNRLVAAKKRGR